MIRRISLAIALSLPIVATAQTSTPISAEQKELSQRLPQTVVIRVDSRDNSVAVLESKTTLQKGSEESVLNAKFTAPVTSAPTQDELDNYTSRDSWYFHCRNYNYNWYPTYYYYGYSYSYQNYYSYSYGSYWYYYYGWRG